MLFLLFIVFFQIGLFTFGGGYAMIPMMEDMLVHQYGWVSEEQLLNFIAVSESTPGPFAINMATFVGTSQYGFLGAVVATLGVVLPSYIIILIVAKLFANFSENKYVKSALSGIRPVVIGLIATVGINLLISNITSLNANNEVIFEWKYLLIVAICFGINLVFKKLNKKMSPIFLILIAACLGLVLYSI